MNLFTAAFRGKLSVALPNLIVGGLVYAALAVGINAMHGTVPISGDVLLALGWVIWKAGHGMDSVPVLVSAVRRWRRDREARRLGDAFEELGIAYRFGSPPSHAAGGAR